MAGYKINGVTRVTAWKVAFGPVESNVAPEASRARLVAQFAAAALSGTPSAIGADKHVMAFRAFEIAEAMVEEHLARIDKRLAELHEG